MAIKEASRSAESGYIDLRDLAGDYAKTPDDGSIAIFRIVALEDVERGDYSTWDMPVTADVLIVECEHNDELNGKIYTAQLIRFAAANQLRGHAGQPLTLKVKELPESVNVPGDEIIARVQLKKGKSPNGFVAINPPSKADKAAALKLRDKLGGDDWGQDADDAPPF